jgi:hypothetical protein
MFVFAKSLTPELTGAGGPKGPQGTNIGHQNREAMANVGVRVERFVRLGRVGRVSQVRSICVRFECPQKSSKRRQLGDTAFNANYLGGLSIHEHVAATKEGLLAMVVECVLPKRSDEHFMCCKGLLMFRVNLGPIGFHDFAKNEASYIVVVVDEDIAVFHSNRVHVRVRVKDAMKCLQRMFIGLAIA